MSYSNIPELEMRKYSSNENQEINVQSEILDPISIDQTHVKFVFQNKGILSSNTRLTLALTGSNNCFPPIASGCNAWVENCEFKANTKTICSCEDYNHWATANILFKNDEERKDVMRFEKGTGFSFNIGRNADSTAPGFLRLDPGSVQDSQTMGTASTNTPVYQIKLSELFPFMASNGGLELPLFLMKEQITLELTLTADSRTAPTQNMGSRVVMNTNQDTGDTAFSTTDIKLVVDYHFYDQDTMQKIQSSYDKNGGFTKSYIDLQLTKITIPAPNLVSPTQDITRQLGGVNREVKGVILMNNDALHDDLLGDYKSNAYAVQKSFNLTINNIELYNSNNMTATELYLRDP